MYHWFCSSILSSTRLPLPGKWKDKLSRFQCILVLKALRADKVTNAMQLLVADKLGQRFIEPQTTDLSSVFKDSSPTSPLVFVLSAGTDPAKSLYAFADEMKFSKRLQAISLGQGQVGNWVVQRENSEMWYNLFYNKGGRFKLVFGSAYVINKWGANTDKFKERITKL